MWTLRRGSRPRGSGDEAVLDGQDAENAWDEARLRAEIARLSANGGGSDPSRLVHLRHLLGIRRVDAAGTRPSHPDPDFAPLPEPGALPEVEPGALTPAVLFGAILRHGCLLVRGLLPGEEALRLAEQIGRCFSERDRHYAGQRCDPGLYCEFVPAPRFSADLGRGWIRQGGGVLAADSPALSLALTELLGRAGLAELAGAYLGEPPLLAAEKTTLRIAEPSVGGAWHQDGKFMGDVNALNVWLSLSRCGDQAPGLDIVPRRIDRYVDVETDDAMFENMISQRMAERAAGEVPIMRPRFEPGDALLFDELFLHKTGSDPSMPSPRFAVESWFFGGSGFPAGYSPIAV